ncbi:DUF4198 domain-containing protein [Cupriavidus sp. NPDC089707]|uniref:DUF4198 domain-containing protein n=1 Tax=Cupriavidus sp. NPDC089707 TaxID=3363963 RepID=UPI00380C9A96
MKTTATAALALLALSGAAQAHQIWIEQAPGQNAVIRFGEFGDNLREASPGLLDKMGAPSATLVSAKGEQRAEGVKTAAGFTLPFTAGGTDTVVAEDAKYPLFKSKQGDKELVNRYYPSARWVSGFAAQAPKLAFDLVPAGQPGAFQLYFQGKPLPKTKVALVTQSGWAKEKQTDEHGMVTFDMPWKGAYVAEASHKEQTPGERQGANGPERFTGVSYVTTLTLVKPDGIEPLPAGPAATPNK